MRRLILGAGLLLAVLAGCKGPVFDEHDNGQRVEVARGGQFVVRLAGSSGSLPPASWFTRPDPAVEGTAVRFVRRQRIKPDRDRAGDRGRDLFVFEAVASGEATVLLSKQSADPERPGRTWVDYRLVVVVR